MDDRPVLIASEGQLEGQRWTIDKEEFVVGRGSDCNIILPERQVSRHHVRITHEDNSYILHDLGSKNGTHLNGQPFTGSIKLNDGDQIQMALSVKLVFVGTGATLPLTFEPPTLEGNLIIDESRRTVRIKNKDLTPPLSLAQFRLLQLLHNADGAVVSRDDIVNTVWPESEGIGVSEQAIDALVRRLRDRLSELDPYNYIVTVRGHGFRLDNKPH